MGAYHQMGNDSRNLLDEVSGYAGAIVSPVNEDVSSVQTLVGKHQKAGFEMVFDPQLYYPRSERGKLPQWAYFPSDFDTADVTSAEWWSRLHKRIVTQANALGIATVCSPEVVPAQYTGEFYRSGVERTNAFVKEVVASNGATTRVLHSVLINYDAMASKTEALQVASIVSGTRADGVFLVIASDERPRQELKGTEELKGIMRLISELEAQRLRCLVGFAGSDLLLWKGAGASDVATGKFFNLRRFTRSRFEEPQEGGGQVPYWFEEGLLALLRSSDLIRVDKRRITSEASAANPFGIAIRNQLQSHPSKPWVALSWRQYLHWFADAERRLANGIADAATMLRVADDNWATLGQADEFMEERTNDGSWIRPWRRALKEFRE